ncbi:MAG: hypothetical protein COV45_09135 [Deltaproteobacteria bacterium CG11_big_fil_rev_8_21_14_0_20_47_16]|nr:MAG: hypothetical protein COV45_09135 [Deltaproteobacteria bacterium CG11_big_fil_rev_8_21_14_0_20_47_16]
MEQDILERCVTYFTHGGPIEWIGGGITIGTLLLTTFTKISVPGIIKAIARHIMELRSGDKMRLK